MSAPLFCLFRCSDSVGRAANLVIPACWRRAEWLSCLTLCGPPPGMVGLLSWFDLPCNKEEPVPLSLSRDSSL